VSQTCGALTDSRASGVPLFLKAALERRQSRSQPTNLELWTSLQPQRARSFSRLAICCASEKTEVFPCAAALRSFSLPGRVPKRSGPSRISDGILSV
jgi:hypothetical protein